jgi:hypothetical protein
LEARLLTIFTGVQELPRPDHASEALAVAICFALAPPLMRLAQ